MNKFLKNLVGLNQTIIANAKTQFQSNQTVSPRSSMAFLLNSNAQVTEAGVNVQDVSGMLRYNIHTENIDLKWYMTIVLDLNESLVEIPYVSMEFNPRYQLSEFVFQEVQKSINTVNQYTARLEIPSLERRDALLYALSDINSETTLVVTYQSEGRKKNIITNPKQFFFATNLYDYIYDGILPPPPRQKFILKSYVFNNHTYSYFQDYITKSNLFYLADSYQIAIDLSTQKPMLSIRFDTNEAGDYTVTFDFFAVPNVNQERIKDASINFKNDQPDGVLIPLNDAKSYQLSLALPEGMREQKDAIINLQSGIIDSFTIPLTELITIWDALFNNKPNNLLLKGQLKVLLEGFNPIHIPTRLSLPEQYKGNIEDFIDTSHITTIPKEIEFRSASGAYDNPIHPIETMLIIIDGQTIDLDKEHPNKKITVKVPILNIINGDPNQVVYKYTLKIRYKDKPEDTFQKQSNFAIIYVPS